MKLNIGNIEWLVENGGEVSIGRAGLTKCAAIASDEGNMIAALKKRKDESVEELLQRLDHAIHLATEEEKFINELDD